MTASNIRRHRRHKKYLLPTSEKILTTTQCLSKSITKMESFLAKIGKLWEEMEPLFNRGILKAKLRLTDRTLHSGLEARTPGSLRQNGS